MTERRPDIPAPVMREVRQRCGFGCVICGLPVYDYDHLLGWAKTERHVADEITLLCDFHHRQKTTKMITDATVERWNARPFNIKHGVSAPYQLNFEESDDIEMLFGGERLYSTGFVAPLVIDDVAPVVLDRTKDGVELYVRLYDRFNRDLLMIYANELVFKADNWDVEFVGQTLTIREGAGKIALRMKFVVPNRVEIERAEIWFNGAHVVVSGSSVSVNSEDVDVNLQSNWYSEVPVVLTVGHCPSYPRPPMRFLQINVPREDFRLPPQVDS